MRSYSIGEVEHLLGEKAHTLRYWESGIRLLSPRRSESGRREYTEAEVFLFLRVRHFVRDCGNTLQKAQERLLREASGPRQDLRALAYEIRSELVRAYFLSISRALAREHSSNAGGSLTCLPVSEAAVSTHQSIFSASI